MSAPLLWLGAAFALGIVAARAPADSLAQTLQSVPLLAALAGAFMLAGLILTRAEWRILAGMLALTGFALSGCAAARLFEFRFSDHHVRYLSDLGVRPRDAVRLTGRLVTSPINIASGVQFDLQVARVEVGGKDYLMDGRMRIYLRRGEADAIEGGEAAQDLKYGDAIRAVATLDFPPEYRDQGVFDYREWMKSIHDIYWVGTIKSSSLVEELPRRGNPTLGELRNRVRRRMIFGIDRLYPPWSREGRDGAVLKAVLLGDRSSLDSQTIENFRRTGLYHLLVISGLHIGLLAMLVALLLRLTGLSELWRSGLLLGFLLAYWSLVEQRAPTTRAVIMIAAYLVARILYRKHSALNGVGLAALVLLLARPPWLFESGFQLSFSAALLIVGLVAPILARTTEPFRKALRNVNSVERDVDFSPKLAQFRLDVRGFAPWAAAPVPFLKDRPAAANSALALGLRGAAWVLNALVFTTILQLGLLLPLAATFHRVTLAGIGLNAVAVPVMTVLLAIAFPTVLLGALSPALAAWPAKLLAVVMNILFAITDLPHLSPWLSYRVASPPQWLAWGFAAAAILAACALGRNRRAFALSFAVMLCFGVLISLDPFSPAIPSGRLEIAALDCGPGDSFFVVLPDRTTMLIDAGGGGSRGRSEDPFESRRWTAGEDIVSPYLWSRQIKKLDIMVMSRGRESQLPSFAALVRNFHVGELWYSEKNLSPLALGFVDELGRRGVRLHAMAAGEQVRRGSAIIQILWPPGERLKVEQSSGLSRVRGMAIRIRDGGANVVFANRAVSRIGDDAAETQPGGFASVLALADPASFESLREESAGSISPRVVLVGGETRNAGKSSPSETQRGPGRFSSQVFHTARDGEVTVEIEGARISVNVYGMPAGAGTSGLASSFASTSSSLSVR